MISYRTSTNGEAVRENAPLVAIVIEFKLVAKCGPSSSTIYANLDPPRMTHVRIVRNEMRPADRTCMLLPMLEFEAATVAVDDVAELRAKALEEAVVARYPDVLFWVRRLLVEGKVNEEGATTEFETAKSVD